MAKSPRYRLRGDSALYSIFWVTDSDVKWFEVIGVHGDVRPKNI